MYLDDAQRRRCSIRERSWSKISTRVLIILFAQVLQAGRVPVADDAVGIAQLGAGHAEQPVVRAVGLPALLGRHVVRRAAVQRVHERGRSAVVGRRAPARGTASAGRIVRVPRAPELSAAGRAARRRAADVGQQPSVRVVRPPVSAERRVRGRHALAAAVVRGRRPGT